MGLLQGKRALITGGTTGLGLAMARRFLAEGAQVVITGRDLALGGQAEQALGPVAPRFTAADAADPEAVAASVRAAAGHLGGLDVLVNNAGVGVTARLVDTPARRLRPGDERQRARLPAVRAGRLPVPGPDSRLHDPHRLGPRGSGASRRPGCTR